MRGGPAAFTVHALPGSICLHVREEDLIWPINRQPPEQVRVNLMLGVFLTRVWRLINRNINAIQKCHRLRKAGMPPEVLTVAQPDRV